MTPEFLAHLAAASLDDVYVTGILDEDESPVQFCAQFRLLYLELDGNILELRCIEDTGELSLALVSKFSEAMDVDDGFRRCMMSIREMVLADPDGENQIQNLKLIGASFLSDCATCAALQFQLENGQTLFLDPSYHFGIRVGGFEQRKVWSRNWPNAVLLKEWNSHSLGDRGPA